jgi:hypothetical protein
VFYEPRGVYRDRDEIDRVVGAIYIAQPDNCVPDLLSIESARYRPIPPPGQLAGYRKSG